MKRLGSGLFALSVCLSLVTISNGALAQSAKKDSKRFADSGGWGWAVFEHDPASGTFTPGTEADQPPQANDAKCGFACHTVVQTKDYVFTKYGRR